MRSFADTAVADGDDAFACASDVDVMADHHDRISGLVQPAKQRQDFFTCCRIERACRLVGQQQGGLRYKGPAMATRCCWPPGKFIRRCLIRSI